MKCLSLTVIIYVLLGWPIITFATESNAGFVQGIWYDSETVVAGHPTRIYVAIRNNTGGDLSGRVEFYVNQTLLERSDVKALANRIIESWADWNPTYGTNTITAILSRTVVSSGEDKSKRVTVVSAEANDVLFVDRDTDNDGLLDQTDPDDDNDGIPDTEEVIAGTDPLDNQDPQPPSTTDDNTNKTKPASGTDESDTSNSKHQTASPNEPAGLEQFLSDNRASRAFQGATQIINTAKANLDTYRSSRNDRLSGGQNDDEAADSHSESAASSTASSTINKASNSVNFGTITRTQGKAPESGLTKVGNIISSALSAVYTFILWVLSKYLAHPVVVQLSFLLLLLITLYKIAKKFGARKTE